MTQLDSGGTAGKKETNGVKSSQSDERRLSRTSKDRKDFRSKIPSPLGKKAEEQKEVQTKSVVKNRPRSFYTKLRRERGNFTKSVILEPTLDEEELNGQPLVKTFSEQDVSNIVLHPEDDENSEPTEHQSLTTVHSGKKNYNYSHHKFKRASLSCAPSSSSASVSCTSSLSNSQQPESLSALITSTDSCSSAGGNESEFNHSSKDKRASGLNNSNNNNNNFSSRIPKRIPNRSSYLPLITSNNSSSNSSSSPLTPSVVKNRVAQNSNKSQNSTKTKSTKSPQEKVPPRTNEFIRPKLVTIIRSGMKPRKAIRFLLNQRTARSFDQVLNDITEAMKPAWGAVRKIYALNGKEVTTLEGFFKDESLLLASPNDRVTPDDFDLDAEECKSMQPYVKLSLISNGMQSSKRVKGSVYCNDATKSPSRRPKSSAKSGSNSNNYTSHPKYIPLSHFPNPILDKYIVGSVIGDGNFAVVRDCTERTTRLKFALKVIDKSKCNQDSPPQHEINILSCVNHPNIISLYEQYDFTNELYLVMELVEGGDLFDAIAKAIKFSEAESAGMTRDVASALCYLHDRKIVHRDIKPENLMVNIDNNDGRKRLKLGDFGLAQIVNGPLYTICGTPTYVAPEILAETGYGLKVDIWAFGVIIYILLSGYPPFVSPTGEQNDLFDQILAGEFDFHPEHWEIISSDAKDLIFRMIESDVDARLSADELTEHPWLAVTQEDYEEKRNKFFRRDFKFSVFETMGLTRLSELPKLPISNIPSKIRAS